MEGSWASVQLNAEKVFNFSELSRNLYLSDENSSDIPLSGLFISFFIGFFTNIWRCKERKLYGHSKTEIAGVWSVLVSSIFIVKAHASVKFWLFVNDPQPQPIL